MIMTIRATLVVSVCVCARTKSTNTICKKNMYKHLLLFDTLKRSSTRARADMLQLGFCCSDDDSFENKAIFVRLDAGENEGELASAEAYERARRRRGRRAERHAFSGIATQ